MFLPSLMDFKLHFQAINNNLVLETKSDPQKQDKPQRNVNDNYEGTELELLLLSSGCPRGPVA